MKILVVDDDYFMIHLIRNWLPQDRVEIVHTAQKAVKAIKESKYDFILCDIYLPGATGDEVAPILRNLSGVPVVEFSNAAGDGHAKSAIHKTKEAVTEAAEKHRTQVS